MLKHLILPISISAAISLSGCGGSKAPDSPHAAHLPPAPTGSGVIRGVVKFSGTPPPRDPIRVGADPTCNHGDKPPLREDVVVNPDGTMRDVIVAVTAGLPSGSHTSTTSPAILDQKGCMYTPHVFAMRVGQTLEVRNSDDTIHNVNGQGKINDRFNFSMASNRVPPRSQTFAAPEFPPFKIKCDVHPWMLAWCAVFDHPYFAVTGTDGKFEIPNLPPGEYTLTSWQQELGTQTQRITVDASGSTKSEFTYSLK